MEPTLVVLAAGMGSRYGGTKQLDTFGPSGETIIDYSIYDAIRAGFKKVVFVIRKNIEEPFREGLLNKFEDKIQVEVVFQELDNLPAGMTPPVERTKPWGTGHAVLVTEEKVAEPFAIINADDFYGRSSFQIMYDELKSMNPAVPAACLVGFKLSNTLSEHGSVSRGVCEVDAEGHLTGITEMTRIKRDNGSIINQEDIITELTGNETVSMNLIGFSQAVFPIMHEMFHEFMKQAGGDLKKEFYIPLVLSRLKDDGVKIPVPSSSEKWIGVTYREDKEDTTAYIQELVSRGEYPASLWG